MLLWFIKCESVWQSHILSNHALINAGGGEGIKNADTSPECARFVVKQKVFWLGKLGFPLKYTIKHNMYIS